MKREKYYPWLIFASCCFLQAGILGIVSNACGIFLSPVCAELGFGRGELSLYITFRGLAGMITLPLAGKLLSGRYFKKALCTGIVMISVSYCSMAFFSKLWQWYVAGILLGLASSFVFFLPVPILINNWFRKKQGMILGIAMMCSGFGGMVANMAGSIMIERFGWRSAQFIMAAAALCLTLPAALFIIKRNPKEAGLQPYGADKEERGKNVTMGRKEVPIQGISQKAALKSPLFYMIVVSLSMFSFAYSYVNHLPGFASAAGIAVTAGATLSSASMAGNIAAKLSIGYMSDKIGVRKTVLLFGSLCSLSLFAIPIFADTWIFLVAACTLLGISMALVAVGTPMVIKDVYGEKDYGVIYSCASVGVNLAGAVAFAMVGYIYDGFGSYYPAFLVGGGLTLFAVFLLAGSFRWSRRIKQRYS